MTSRNAAETPAPEVAPFTESFRKAEKAIKEAETVVRIRCGDSSGDCIPAGLFIPAVNELRYAGCHIARYLEGHVQSDLDKAVAHCQRAEFDAYDCCIQFLLDECHRFQDDYENVVIPSVVPNYSDLILSLSRISRTAVPRDELTQQAVDQKQKDYNKLAGIYDTFQVSRSELNKLVRDKNKNSTRWWWAIIIAAASLVVSILKR